MSRVEYYFLASGVGAVAVGILAIIYPAMPKIIGLPIVGALVILSIYLVIKGMHLKPEKQVETSKGLFVIDIIKYEFGNVNIHTRRTLILHVLFHIIPSRLVESFQLKILHYFLSTEWEPEIIGTNLMTEGGELDLVTIP